MPIVLKKCFEVVDYCMAYFAGPIKIYVNGLKIIKNYKKNILALNKLLY